MNKILVAAAGEQFVAFKLSCLGYLAAPVRVGSPVTDLLAATLDGSRTVAIQVKTTGWAERTRGRGTNKTLHHLEFPLGHAAVEKASEKLIFCFVDLRDRLPNTLPDVYIVPATTILTDYKGWNVRQHSFFRHHRSIQDLAPFKNEWKPIIKALS